MWSEIARRGRGAKVVVGSNDGAPESSTESFEIKAHIKVKGKIIKNSAI